jgi:hypothetical protein
MAVGLPDPSRLSNGVVLDCLEVGAAPRAALVVAAHFQVTGDGHGFQSFGSQPCSFQPQEPGCQLCLALWSSGPPESSPANYPVSLWCSL